MFAGLNSQRFVATEIKALNPYAPPSEIGEPSSFRIGQRSRVLPQWVSVVWDSILVVTLGINLPSMVDATFRLFARQPFDLQTVSKLPERWVFAFFLLSLSAFFAVQRHVAWRVIYGLVVGSYLLQHFPDGWLGDLITAAIAAVVFLPIFTHGFGWLGVARSIVVWNAGRPRRTSGGSRQSMFGTR